MTLMDKNTTKQSNNKKSATATPVENEINWPGILNSVEEKLTWDCARFSECTGLNEMRDWLNPTVWPVSQHPYRFSSNELNSTQINHIYAQPALIWIFRSFSNQITIIIIFPKNIHRISAKYRSTHIVHVIMLCWWIIFFNSKSLIGFIPYYQLTWLIHTHALNIKDAFHFHPHYTYSRIEY